MKKFTKITAVIALIVVSAMCLVGCGSDPLEGDTAVGTWKLSSAKYQGIEINGSDLTKSLGKKNIPELVISADGNGTLKTNDQTSTGTVTKNEDGEGYIFADSDDNSLDFTIDGTKLTLNYKTDSVTMTMYFTKSSDDTE